MTWIPDCRNHEPQQHPEHPEVKFITGIYATRSGSQKGLCAACPFNDSCKKHPCEGGYFITRHNLIVLRLTGTL